MPDDWAAVWRQWTQFFEASPLSGGRVEGWSPMDPLTGYREFLESLQKLAAPASSLDAVDRINEFVRSLKGAAASDWSNEIVSVWSSNTAKSASQARGKINDSAAKLESVFGTWSSELTNLPAIGPLREWQQASQNLHHALLNERQAHLRLTDHVEQSLSLAQERFGAYLRDDRGPPITSIRILYDDWIDIAEDSYQKIVMSETFSKDFGAFINANTRTRLALKAIQQRGAENTGLPSARDFELLLNQLNDLTREVADLRKDSSVSAMDVVSGPPVTRTTGPATAKQSLAKMAARQRKPRKVAVAERRKNGKKSVSDHEFTIDKILPPDQA
jgi:polyhydroxyalkanoate synthase subunit PhaE